MAPRLGIAVRAQSIAAVLVRGDRCVWKNEVALERGECVAGRIARLLSPMPRFRIARPRVVVAIGPHSAQTKRLHGLPVLARPRVLLAAVRENIDALFLRRTGPLVIPSIMRTADGAAIGVAFEVALLREIVDALRDSKLRLAIAVPTVVAVAALTPNDSFLWSDAGDRIHLEVISKRGELHDVKRLSDLAAAEWTGRLPVSIGERTTEHVDAYAAAVLRRSALGWRPEAQPRRTKMLERLRIAAAVASLALATLSVLLAPGIRSRDVAARASAELALTRDQRLELARIDGHLRRVTDILNHIERFRAQRGALTLVAGALSDALPESTAIVSLRMDTLEVSFVSLAVHAVDVLPQLVGLSNVVAPRLVGSVTREMVGTTRLERATFRFRRRAASKASSPRSVTATYASRGER